MVECAWRKGGAVMGNEIDVLWPRPSETEIAESRRLLQAKLRDWDRVPAVAYAYLQSEPGLWTVGFYTPQGKWEPESDLDSRETAAERVAWLNGSPVDTGPIPDPGLEAAWAEFLASRPGGADASDKFLDQLPATQSSGKAVS
jgi:hypothetical protein